MESKSEKAKRLSISGRCVGAMAGGYTMARIKRLQSYTATTRAAGMTHVEAILERGNCARMKNVAGSFIVSEVVLA
ncbi:MAG TPA: hypothetical protein DIW64_16200 [Cellvibrio sp.]|nr:hypothetical protein [Cellvibrio sp.]